MTEQEARERAEEIGRAWVTECRINRQQVVVHPKQVDDTLAHLMTEFIIPHLLQARAEAIAEHKCPGCCQWVAFCPDCKGKIRRAAQAEQREKDAKIAEAHDSGAVYADVNNPGFCTDPSECAASGTAREIADEIRKTGGEDG